MLDVLVRASVPLAHGSDVRGSIEFYPGGSAANFAVWAARCGAQVSFFGALGNDFLSDYLLDDLRSEGVNCDGVVRLPGRSPSVLALVGPDGERTMVTDRRVTLSLDATCIKRKELTGVQHLHLTGYSLFDPGPRRQPKPPSNVPTPPVRASAWPCHHPHSWRRTVRDEPARK